MRPAQKLPVPAPLVASRWKTTDEGAAEEPAIAGLWFLYRFRPPGGFNEWRLPLIGA